MPWWVCGNPHPTYFFFLPFVHYGIILHTSYCCHFYSLFCHLPFPASQFHSLPKAQKLLCNRSLSTTHLYNNIFSIYLVNASDFSFEGKYHFKNAHNRTFVLGGLIGSNSQVKGNVCTYRTLNCVCVSTAPPPPPEQLFRGEDSLGN